MKSDILFEPQELFFIFWPKFTGHGIIILIKLEKILLVRDIINIVENALIPDISCEK